MDVLKPSRRVYAREIKDRTGWSDTWLRLCEKAGRIPASRKDVGGRRKWWTEADAEAIVNGGKAEA